MVAILSNMAASTYTIYSIYTSGQLHVIVALYVDLVKLVK